MQEWKMTAGRTQKADVPVVIFSPVFAVSPV